LERALADQRAPSGRHHASFAAAMPILTFPLALVFSTCFVVGCLVTWALQERRRRQERDELERQMTRALQTRYEVYEGLEQTVVKLVTKFDAMESEFKQRLMQSGAPQRPMASAVEQPERGLRVRSSNPELWDIEREHHRVTSEQLAEIARRSTRITELMEQVQALEPAKNKLESELTGLRHRFDNAVANAAEFEQAANAKVGRLETRVGELEPLGSLLELAQRDLERARAEHAQLDNAARERAEQYEQRLRELEPLVERVAQLEGVVQRRDAELGEQRQRVAELEPLAVRSAELETLVSERDSEVGDQKLRILELEGEFAGTKLALDKQRARAVEFEGRVKALEQELAGANAQASAARGAQESTRGELETLKKELTLANQRCEVYTADLAKARASLDEARAQAVGASKRLDEVQLRVVELEGEFGRVQGDLQAQQARAEQSGRELREQLGATQARAQSSETQLEELRATHATQSTQANERIQTLSKELEQARVELTLHRAKLAAHSSHVVEAWSVLSELKPMLETLEQKLKESDEPNVALPNKAESNASAKSN
jgi:chromosome segregation ATPase